MHALVRERALTAQEVFKDQYAQTLRWSVLGAVVVLILAVLVMPEYRPVPYRLTNDPTTITEIELEAPPVDEAPPRESPQQPVIEPVTNDDPNAVEDPQFVNFLVDIPPANPDWTGPVDDTPFVVAQEKPRLLQGAVADYPEMARLAGMQGTVVIKVLVAEDGSVARVEVLKGVHPLLDRPALAAARKLVFAPGTQRSMPVRCFVAVPFRFYLH